MRVFFCQTTTVFLILIVFWRPSSLKPFVHGSGLWDPRFFKCSHFHCVLGNPALSAPSFNFSLHELVIWKPFFVRGNLGLPLEWDNANNANVLIKIHIYLFINHCVIIIFIIIIFTSKRSTLRNSPDRISGGTIPGFTPRS